MNFLFTSDFKTVAAQYASLVFPTIQFQVLCKKIGSGNVAIIFKNHKYFADNFRIKFFPRLKKITISGYSKEGIFQLNYSPENNYEWQNGSNSLINKPACVGDKFELFARKFYTLLQEFFLSEGFGFDDLSIFSEFETAATEIAVRAFPLFHFRLSYSKNRQKELNLNFRGDRRLEIRSLRIETLAFHKPESILFNIDFLSQAKCLVLNVKWESDQYLLFYNSSGYLSWSKLHFKNINPPAVFGKEFETIAIQIYPLLQEFFPG